MLRAFEDHYGELALSVVEKALAGDGTFDGIRALAAELPLLAICEITGAAAEDRFRIFEWSNIVLSSEDPDYTPTPDAFQDAVTELIRFAAELADRKRRDPGDDLIERAPRSRRDDAPDQRRVRGPRPPAAGGR